jgi:hypothetical protein
LPSSKPDTSGKGESDMDLESAQLKSEPRMHRRGNPREVDLAIATQESNSVNARTVQLVKLITEVGPDVPEISRRLGQFKESVRYRYKEKILNKGFAVQGMPDYEKLGLKRVILRVEFGEEYHPYEQSILTAMNELCYVTNFVKTLPHGSYIVDANVPKEHLNSFIEFMQELKRMGLFSRLESTDFEWVRYPPMRAEYYDFNVGRWDFDWPATVSTDPESASYLPSERQKFDYTDLLLIKEFMMDANKSIAEISEKLKVNYKKLAWHYTTHVLGRGLIKTYRVNWVGTKYDYKIDKALHRTHRYLPINFLVRDLTEVQRMELMAQAHKIPFLFFEAVGKSYFADFVLPSDSITEGLKYLENMIAPYGERAEFYIADVTNALAFTISYPLFDQAEKRWTFNPKDLLSRFDNLLMKIREGSAGASPANP